MASIRKRSDTGLLFIDFYYQGVRCREQTALPDNAANRRKIQKLIDKIEADISLGSFDYRRYFPNSRNAEKSDAAALAAGVAGLAQPAGARPASTAPSSQGPIPPTVPATPPLRDFADTWFAEKEVEWRRSHRRGIRDILDRKLFPRFGEMEVGRITKAQILAFRAELAKVQARGKDKPLSRPRINKILNPLRQILNEAADRFDFRTPFQGIKQLRVPRIDVDPFSLDEVKTILDRVRPDFRNYFTLRFFTGMRTGEADGLKWKYVDFERRLILVRETVVAGREEYTKTDGSQRDIQMSQIVFDALKSQEKATRNVSAFVFCTGAGTPLAHKNVTCRVWYPLLRHLGFKSRRPYQCRHTAATLWLACGESPEWIARQLGHTTTEMLFRVYSRFVPNLTRRDGSAFERLITGALGDGERQLAAEREDGHAEP